MRTLGKYRARACRSFGSEVNTTSPRRAAEAITRASIGVAPRIAAIANPASLANSVSTGSTVRPRRTNPNGPRAHEVKLPKPPFSPQDQAAWADADLDGPA